MTAQNNPKPTVLEMFVPDHSLGYRSNIKFLSFPQKLHYRTSCEPTEFSKLCMLRVSARDVIFKNHSRQTYTTAKSFEHFGKFLIEFTVLYYKGLAHIEVPGLVMVVSAFNLANRSEQVIMLLSKQDLVSHVDSRIQHLLLSGPKLYTILDRFTNKLVLKRRYLRKRLELSPIKSHDGLLVSYANEFSPERDVGVQQLGSRFVQRKYHESELVGRFFWKHNKKHTVVTVRRHTSQKLFTVEVYVPRTFKTGVFRLSYFDVAEVVGMNMIQILGMKFEYVQYLSMTYKPKTYADFRDMLTKLNSQELKILEFRDKRKYIALENLDTEISSQRFVLLYVWERLVSFMNLATTSGFEHSLNLFEFQACLRHSLGTSLHTSAYCPDFILELRLAKHTIGGLFTPLNSIVSTQALMDLEIYVTTYSLASGDVSNEKTAIRKMYPESHEYIVRVREGSFKIYHLLRIAKELETRVVQAVNTSKTTRLSRFISAGWSGNHEAKLPKVKVYPRGSFIPINPSEAPLFADTLPLNSPLRGLSSLSCPLTILSKKVLTLNPRKVGYCLLINSDELGVLLQTTETGQISFRTYPVTHLEGAVPFIRRLLEEKRFDVVGERVLATVHNQILVDDCFQVNPPYKEEK